MAAQSLDAHSIKNIITAARQASQESLQASGLVSHPHGVDGGESGRALPPPPITINVIYQELGSLPDELLEPVKDEVERWVDVSGMRRGRVPTH